MTLITPDKGLSNLEAETIRVQKQLSDLAAEMEEFQQKVRDGEIAGITDKTKTLADVRKWILLAMETEAKFEEHSKKDQGIARDYAIDFADARSQIGCQLDRLRRSKCPGRFSE